MPAQLHDITTLEELESAVAASAARPVVIFKHSPTCGLSAQAFESIRELLDRQPSEAGWFLLPVRTSRGVSSAVTTRFGIRHESPQALILFEGKVAWHGSHFRAMAASISAALDRLAGATSVPESASR
jgi:bacillithiol system protein YtxJ